MTEPATTVLPWSVWRRIAFRFVFAYLLLTCFPVPEGLVDGPPWLVALPEGAWHRLVPWVGKHLLRLHDPIVVRETGSGDTTYAFVKLLCCTVLAVLATGVWSSWDRRRPHYASLHRCLRVYLRMILAASMFGYGLAKIFRVQFPEPFLDRLMQPYGDSSPMGLLWTFMGASAPYTIIAGLAEFIGGVLLFFPRTVTLGALLLIGVLGNVVTLNLCYDVPVKLGSTHLFLIAVFLTLPDLRRLADVLLFNRPTAAAPRPAPFSTRWKRIGARAAKVLLLAYLLIVNVREDLDIVKKYGAWAPRPPLYGLWDVESFTRGATLVPPLLTDATRWRRVTVQMGDSLRVHTMTGERRFYSMEVDPKAQVLTLKQQGEGKEETVLHLRYKRPDREHLVLENADAGTPLLVQLRRIDETKFLLRSRGFHFINEFPFNR